MENYMKTITITSVITGTILMIGQVAIPGLEQVMGYLYKLAPYLAMIIQFVQPTLLLLGDVIKNTVEGVQYLLPFGDLTYYGLVAIIILFVAILLAIKMPGDDEIKD